MHTIIDQLIPPNVVNYARKFRSKVWKQNGDKTEYAETDLIACVKTNLIEVYFLESSSKTLQFFSKHTFSARIEAIQVLPMPHKDSDWIFISFPECKVSVFEYNGLVNEFVARSLHFFERENYRTNSVFGTNASLRPTIQLDPEGRMAAVRVFSSFVALIPIDNQGHDHHLSNAVSSEETNLQSNVISFATQIDSRLKRVKNLIFLPGFLNPTIAILYDRGSNEGENDSSLPLRTELNHRDTTHPRESCAVMIVAIEPVLKYRAVRADSSPFQFTVVNCIEGIPYDAESMFALSKPVGGIFITCNNLLLWCDVSSSTAPYSIALNHFAPLTYSGRISIAQFQTLNLASLLDCRFLTLQPPQGNVLRCLFVTKHGEKLVVSIARTGQSLGFFNIERMEHGCKVSMGPSDLIHFDEETVFIASDGGNCQLVSLYSKDNNEIIEVEKPSDPNSSNIPISKPEKQEKAQIKDEIDEFLYGDDVEMASASSLTSNSSKAAATDDDYLMTLVNEEQKMTSSVKATHTAKGKNSKKGHNNRISFELIDEISCLGPMIDLAVGNGDIRGSEIVSIGGAFTDPQSGSFYPGSINVLTRKISPVVQLSFNLPDTKNLWTINSNTESKYLVASTSSSTLVLTTSQARIVELEESDFYLEGATIFCSSLADDLIVQIYGNGLRTLRLTDALMVSEIQADFNAVKKAAVVHNSIVCLYTSGLLKVLSRNLEVVQSFKEVSTFECHPSGGLFVAFDNGSLMIFDSSSNPVFQNPFFSRLPVALSNNPAQSDSNSAIKVAQKVISLDYLIENSVLVVRFEAERSVGIAAYRMIGEELFQRIFCELLPHSVVNNPRPGSVIVDGKEVILSLEDVGTDSKFPLLSFALNDRQQPRLHILFSEDLAIIACARYNQNSLLTLKDNGNVSIIDLQKMRQRYNVDWMSGWYLRRIPLSSDRIPTYISFHGPSRTYLVASAEYSSDFTLPTDEYAPISDNPTAEPYIGTVPKLFSAMSTRLHLINPLSWSVVDEISENFLPYESATCMRCMELETRQTASGFSPFLVVGTAYQKSEDRPIRGRTLVFDVAEVVPEPGRPETNRKLRLKGITEFKGPVLAMTPLRNGNVVFSVGPKVVINTFEEDEKFAGVAFHDIGTCSLSLASIKSFFVTADLCKSVAFLAFQADPLARIHELGRDFGQNLQCGAVEFLINSHGQVQIVTSDNQGGLHFYAYAPNNLTTNSGQRLLDRGSFYLHGAPVNRLYRITGLKDEMAVLSANQDGSMNLISPIDDISMFRRLFVAEIRLSAVLPSAGGLVSRVCRQVPRRMNVTHAIPATTSQYNLTLPTSAIRVAAEEGLETTANAKDFNSTLILHNLPVSNNTIDVQAIKRLLTDPLCDGLARQIFANRFGINYETLMSDITQIYQNDF